MRRKEQGFTLIELIVVIIIVGILASVAVPMMTANVKRARTTEALAGLGAIRTAERLYALENNNKYKEIANTDWSSGTALPGIGANDLNGTFYSRDCYLVSTADNNTTFTANCVGAYSVTVPQASKAAGDSVWMKQDGSYGGDQ